MEIRRPFRIVLTVTAALALSACGSLVPAGSSAAGADSRTGTGPSYTPAPGRIASAPQNPVPRSSDQSCVADLSAAGARFTPLPDRYTGRGCSTLGSVELSALSGDASQFSISNLGPVQCRVASVFGQWARFGVDRAARQILGSPLSRIETMGSYSCRTVAGSSRLSAHATAEAIDVSGFVLEDGRRITLSAHWDHGSDAEREFLRVVHRSACRRFGTVLGPDYNRAHEDHFHLEKAAEGSGFCR